MIVLVIQGCRRRRRFALVATNDMGVVGIYTFRSVPCVRDIYDRSHDSGQWVFQPIWVAQQAGRLDDVVE